MYFPKCQAAQKLRGLERRIHAWKSVRVFVRLSSHTSSWMIRGTVYEKRRAEKNPCPSCGLSFYERTLVSVIADFGSCGHGGVGLM